ncbi:molybdopterin-guanine dinucleotide biosynthesis protein MobA, partial [Coprococcus comes]
MALYHFSIAQIKRSAGQSAIASAAYRAGERL